MEDGALEGCVEDDEELLKELTPHIGMEFESEEAAFQFYNEYGRIMGFGIRRDYHTKSKKDGLMINRKFVCHREGEKEKDKRCHIVIQPRREMRTKCSANLYISFNRDSKKWEVKKFDDAHNHLPDCAYLMSTQRNLYKSQGVNVKIADKFFLGRWRLDAKGCSSEERHVTEDEDHRLDAKGCSSEERSIIEDEDDPKLVKGAMRFRDLCPRMINLAARSSEYDEAYKLVDETIRDLCTKVDNMIIASGVSSSGGHMDVGLDVVDPNLQQAKGLKKRAIALKGHARLKPWHERIAKREKVVSQSHLTQVIEKPQDHGSVHNSSSHHPQDVEIPTIHSAVVFPSIQ